MAVKKISAIVRCFNEEKHIGKLLRGLQSQTLPPDEIIVVDSGSTDASLAIASLFSVEIISIPKAEFSFGRALNLGCAKAKGDLLLIASAHVYPTHSNWIERMAAALADPKVAMVYGKQRGDGQTKFSEEQIFKRWFPNRSNLEQVDPFCNNANAMIRRAQWKEWAYDESLPALEDLGWSKVAIEKGYRLSYVADAEVIHVHDESYERIYYRYQREAQALHILFPNEGFSVVEFIRLFLWNALTDMKQALLVGALLRKFVSILAFRFAQYWGAYRGFHLSKDMATRLKEKFYFSRNDSDPILPETSSPGAKPIDYSTLTSPPSEHRRRKTG